MTKLYILWLQFLRYANTIDLYGAKLAGNIEAMTWNRLRIAELDRQIDNLEISL